MHLWNGGIHEGHPVGGNEARIPRSLDRVGIVAVGADDAVAQLKDEWRACFGDEPPSALIGVSLRPPLQASL